MAEKQLESPLETLFSDAAIVEPSEAQTLANGVSESKRSTDLPQPGSGDPNGQQNLVIFELDGQTYGLPVATVVQIIEMVTITPVPQSNCAVEGVINVRGTAVPVVNLRCHLGLPVVPLQLRTPIILVRVDHWTVGLIVDEVIDVFGLGRDQIVRAADVLPEEFGKVPLLEGLIHTTDGTVLLLDLEHLFLPGQKQALIQALEALAEMVEKEALEGKEKAQEAMRGESKSEESIT